MIAASTTLDPSAKQTLLAVVQVWLDRLQTMSVVTTFFVSIDSMLYGYASAALPPASTTWSNADLLKTATLGGAIILHVCASILAYLASFVLIRYRLDSAKEQAQTREHLEAFQAHDAGKLAARPADTRSPTLGSSKSPAQAQVEPIRVNSLDFRSLVSVYQVRPFAFAYRRTLAGFKPGPEAPPPGADPNDAVALRTLQAMVETLTRCHTVVAGLSNVGFVLAVVGTITYFWTALPVALGSFASVCLGASLIAGVYAIM
ncbi:hypothetical protein C8Q79DRAFT_912548 [Trametes meyenii]|nr:hypothetical protein C8Q79DRAFT_912548 [Trametes meyenii]